MNPAPARAQSDASSFAALAPGGVFARLGQLGVIEVHGPDAAAFLHNQLTNDIETLASGAARLAGYCSPKGRLLATMLAYRHGETISLLLSAELAASMTKRLAMYVLRSKAKLADRSADMAVLGFAGDAEAVLSRYFVALPDTVLGQSDSENGTLLRVADALEQRRYLWIGPRALLDASVPALDDALTRVEAPAWDWLDVRAGEPRVTAATQEQFVPQMVNLEAVGGVNFRKGCYPGQEVVARSQYRGTIKRRMLLATTAAAVAPGSEVFHSEDPDQPCGMVVNAGPCPDGRTDCLVEVKLSALDAGSIHAGAPDGPILDFMALPYPLPDAA